VIYVYCIQLVRDAFFRVRRRVSFVKHLSQCYSLVCVTNTKESQLDESLLLESLQVIFD